MKYIIGLSFGKGEINREIGRIIKELINADLTARVIVQEDLHEQTRDFLPVSAIIKEREHYLDTIEVLKRAKEIIEMYLEPKEIILVCHELHQKRANAIANKIGLKIHEIQLLKMGLDRNDAQRHCRNKLFYKLWDIPAWIRYFLE